MIYQSKHSGSVIDEVVDKLKDFDPNNIDGGSVQSDWSQTDSTQNDFIKNKPTFAKINGYDITNDYNIPIIPFMTGGTTVQTVYKNALFYVLPIIDTDCNITVPRTGELLNYYFFIPYQSGTISFNQNITWANNEPPVFESNVSYLIQITCTRDFNGVPFWLGCYGIFNL